MAGQGSASVDFVWGLGPAGHALLLPALLCSGRGAGLSRLAEAGVSPLQRVICTLPACRTCYVSVCTHTVCVVRVSCVYVVSCALRVCA